MLTVKRGIPLYEQIYENLKESIVAGEFVPGERIVDAWIAEKLSVSRSPVREAFRKLEQDGLLVNRDGITFVYEPNVGDVIELFQVRAGLESIAVFMATQLMTDDQIKDLGNSLSLVEKALNEKRLSDVVKLNTYFHECIISSSQNLRLQEMMGKINTLTLLYRNTFFKKYYGNDDFLSEHHEVWKAINSRNPDLASKKMRDHILNDLVFLKDRLSEQMKEST